LEKQISELTRKLEDERVGRSNEKMAFETKIKQLEDQIRML
jgi:hypothetical protein